MSTHVIFDLNQTLTDSDSVLNNIHQDFANKLGNLWKYTNYGEMGSEQIFDDFISKMGICHENQDQIDQLRRDMVKEFNLKDQQTMLGVDKLLRHLHDHNIQMAIATSNKMKVTEYIIKKTNGLNRAWFSHIISGGDDPEVKNNKPAPDIYWVTAKRFNPSPKSMDSCVIFEDSVKGITGAVESGMKTVLINAIPVHELGAIADKITVIVDSLENFRPESVGLPPYQ